MSRSIEKDRRSVKRLRPEEIETVIIDTAFEDLDRRDKESHPVTHPRGSQPGRVAG
jgi:hypothetical protein